MATSSVSFSAFTPDKRGYNSYLKTLGVNKGEFNAFVETFPQFVRAVEAVNPKGKIDGLYNDLEKINDLWLDALESGQDDTDVNQDAFHLKGNAKRIVLLIEELEK